MFANTYKLRVTTDVPDQSPNVQRASQQAARESPLQRPLFLDLQHFTHDRRAKRVPRQQIPHQGHPQKSSYKYFAVRISKLIQRIP